MSTDERVAVLETQVKRNEKDLTKLFEILRLHMKKEDRDREQFLLLIGNVNNKLDKQKSFWAGMMFAFTGVGALIGSAIVYLKG